MVNKSDEFTKDIMELSNRIKRFREKVLDELLQKENQVSTITKQDILKLTKKEYDELDKFLDKFYNKMLINIYKRKEFVQFEFQDVVEDLKTMRNELRAKRKELKGSNVSETTKNIIKYMEKQFKKMGRKVRKALDLDSNFDLVKNLK